MLKVSFFAGLAEHTGKRAVNLPIDQSITVNELRSRIIDQFPEVRHIVDTCMVAVNQEYADNDVRITVDDEVALIPPLSGG